MVPIVRLSTSSRTIGDFAHTLVTAIVTEAVDGCSERRPRFAELRSSLPVIVPALLMCDFGHLADEIQRIEAAGAQVLHLDVMDGHFVPNLTYGLTIVDAVRRYTQLPIETHLMISNPADYIEAYHNAGADHLTFHVEAVDDPRPLLRKIRQLGAGAGLAFNPPTPISAVEPFLADCDSVLVMGVMPGFGGQEFDLSALDKLRALRTKAGAATMLAVDGGIHPATVGSVTGAGAQLVVAGSAIFAKENYRQALQELTSIAARGAKAAKNDSTLK